MQRHLINFLLLLFTTSNNYASSIYDGIWQYNASGKINYCSITITGNELAIINLTEVAHFQDPAQGTYIGTTSTDLAKGYPGAILEAYGRIQVPRNGGTSYLPSFEIFFTSANAAIMGIPQRDYPQIDLIPFSSATKIF